MGHRKKTRSHAQNKGKDNASSNNGTTPSESEASRQPWVHQLEFEQLPPAEIDADSNTNESVSTARSDEVESISVISFNILADSYCSRKSHRNLPRQYQNVVFDRKRRGRLIRKILVASNEICVTGKPGRPLRPDIWALQEVDMDEVLNKHLRSVGYDGVETPRIKTGGGSGGKVDACGIYYRTDKWTLLDQELIRFDDLATLLAPAQSSMEAELNDANNQSAILRSLGNNLQGLQQSLLRRNTGILVRLQSIHSKRTVVVAAAHLFWNPAYEYVKLCQAHYLMIRVHAFAQCGEPLIVCGDFNSLPGGRVHSYFTKGVVMEPWRVAPWFHNDYDADNDAVISDGTGACENGGDNRIELDDAGGNDGLNDINDGISNLGIDPAIEESGPARVSMESSFVECFQPPPMIEKGRKQQIRYLLDYNLNRLCRWMRILGIDTGLETEAEERLRTKNGDIRLFDRCRNENRVLVTTSTKLLARKDCPPGAYLISTKSLAISLEAPLVHILLTHGVILDPDTFLSRCVVCNGSIEAVHDAGDKRKIFSEHQAPIDVSDSMEVYKCDGCGQGYWWCDRPTSSASRVKMQATKLYELCLRGQVPVLSEAENNSFWGVDVESERRKGWDWSTKGSELLKLNLQVTDWLKMDELPCPRQKMQSAYRDTQTSGEVQPFTNVTFDFEGTLDYIFYDKHCLSQTERLYVPTAHGDLNWQQIHHGHLLPSNIWPSDHLAIGATLVWGTGEQKQEDTNAETGLFCTPVASVNSEGQQPVNLRQHGQRCACGCVPKMPSLFEMAELRKQDRLKRESQASG